MDERKSWSSGLRALDLLLPMVVTFVLSTASVERCTASRPGACCPSCSSANPWAASGLWRNCLEGFNNGIFLHHHRCRGGRGQGGLRHRCICLVQENIINLPLPGLVKVAAITTIIAGITGSASGGLTIALELFGETFISWVTRRDHPPGGLHRLRRTGHLPWNGTVVMLFALSGVSYKKGYKHVAMETVILPLLSLILYLSTIPSYTEKGRVESWLPMKELFVVPVPGHGPDPGL